MCQTQAKYFDMYLQNMYVVKRLVINSVGQRMSPYVVCPTSVHHKRDCRHRSVLKLHCNRLTARSIRTQEICSFICLTCGAPFKRAPWWRMQEGLSRTMTGPVQDHRTEARPVNRGRVSGSALTARYSPSSPNDKHWERNYG